MFFFDTILIFLIPGDSSHGERFFDMLFIDVDQRKPAVYSLCHREPLAEDGWGAPFGEHSCEKDMPTWRIEQIKMY